MYYFYAISYFLKLSFNIGVLSLFYIAFESETGSSSITNFAIGFTKGLGFYDRWDPQLAGNVASSFVVMFIVNIIVLVFLLKRKARVARGTMVFEIVYGFVIGIPIFSVILFSITFTDRFKKDFGIKDESKPVVEGGSWTE